MSKAEILELLPKLGRDERREIFDRLCDLEEAEFSESHQKLVDEALCSGPARHCCGLGGWPPTRVGTR